MALSRAQARENHIIDSMALFLTRNLKLAYDDEVSTLAYPTPLTIRAGQPDDESLILKAPCVMIDTVGAPHVNRYLEIGSNNLWRYTYFVFHCYPALANGSPSSNAAGLLKSYMMDAFGTEYMRIVDFTSPDLTIDNIVYCDDVAKIYRVGDPVDAKTTTVLAEEKHRFDMSVAIQYPVLESDAT